MRLSLPAMPRPVRDAKINQEYLAAGLQTIIQTCTGIPDIIKRTTVTSVIERTLDQRTFEQLVCQAAPGGAMSSDWSLRLQRRRDALSKYVGHTLTCVYGRLPSSHYTIEVDLVRAMIVHWEGQGI